MRLPAPILVFALLLAACFSLATMVDPRSATLAGHDRSDGLLKVLLGDGRQIFANHYFEKADIYFHSGYYPSFLEQSYGRSGPTRHFAEDHHDHHDDNDAHHDEKEEQEEHEHEHTMDFLGKPSDWIDRFGRHFYSTHHSHLDKPGAAREILPWLKISAELDPHRIETYTVAAYWLRNNMSKPDEAEQFLRDGLRANPSSYEILFDLGQIYWVNHHDPERARNLWELALRRWKEQEAAKLDPNPVTEDEIVGNLAHLEEQQGNLSEALKYLQIEVKISPSPESIQQQIDELKAKISVKPAK